MIQEKSIIVQNIDATSITQNHSPVHSNVQFLRSDKLVIGT